MSDDTEFDDGPMPAMPIRTTHIRIVNVQAYDRLVADNDTLRALLAEALPYVEGYASVTGLPGPHDLVTRLKKGTPS